MIQFNRRRVLGDDSQYSMDISQYIGMISSGFSTKPWLGAEALNDLADKYKGDARIAAIAARMAVWHSIEWDDLIKMLPEQLPDSLIYRQELVGCLGFERAHRQWGINEDEWYIYTGFAHQAITPGGRVIHGQLSYRPKGRHVFEIIEDLVAASVYAEVTGYQLHVDTDGDWWRYEEPFEEVFGEIFDFSHGEPVSKHFEAMRSWWLKASIEDIAEFSWLKQGWYNEIYYLVNEYVSGSLEYPDDVGVIYLRGQDAFRLETIPPPVSLIWRDLNWMSRFVRERHIISEDTALAQMIKTGYPSVVDHSNLDHSRSVLSELQTYLRMAEAKLNWSCPSSPIVNAAQWSRNDRENLSQANPVYRYLML